MHSKSQVCVFFPLFSLRSKPPTSIASPLTPRSQLFLLTTLCTDSMHVKVPRRINRHTVPKGTAQAGRITYQELPWIIHTLFLMRHTRQDIWPRGHCMVFYSGEDFVLTHGCLGARGVSEMLSSLPVLLQPPQGQKSRNVPAPFLRWSHPPFFYPSPRIPMLPTASLWCNFFTTR